MGPNNIPATVARHASQMFGSLVAIAKLQGMLLDDAQRVVIVPGYGLAMAQAQHAVRDMANVLESWGVDVIYAIHPVAGRMTRNSGKRT